MQFTTKAVLATLALAFSVTTEQLPRKANAVEARGGDWDTTSTVTVTLITVPAWCTTSSGIPLHSSAPATISTAPATLLTAPATPSTAPGLASSLTTATVIPTASSLSRSLGPSGSVSSLSIVNTPSTAPGPASSLGVGPSGSISSLSAVNTPSPSASTGKPTGSSPSSSASAAASTSVTPGSSASMNQVMLGLAFVGLLINAVFLMA